MILLLSSFSKSWSQNNSKAGKYVVMGAPSTGKPLQSDTIKTKVAIDIDYIRAANEKLISYNYLLKEVDKKDSIILIQNRTINEIRSIVVNADKQYSKLQNNNEQLKKQVVVLKKQRWYLAGVSAGAIVALLVGIIAK